MCAKARELLGDMEANNEAIQKGLQAIARQMFNEKTKTVTNPLGVSQLCMLQEGEPLRNFEVFMIS